MPMEHIGCKIMGHNRNLVIPTSTKNEIIATIARYTKRAHTAEIILQHKEFSLAVVTSPVLGEK